MFLVETTRQCDTFTNQDTAGTSVSVHSIPRSHTRTLPARRKQYTVCHGHTPDHCRRVETQPVGNCKRLLNMFDSRGKNASSASWGAETNFRGNGHYSDHDGEIRMAAVTKPKPPPSQLEELLRQLIAKVAAPAPVPAPVPVVPTVAKLLRRLAAMTQRRQPVAASPPEPGGLTNVDRSFISGQQTSGPQTRQRPISGNRNSVVCFSCGKSGHTVTRCPALDESFPFMLPGWSAESTSSGFVMISPNEAAKRRRAENED